MGKLPPTLRKRRQGESPLRRQRRTVQSCSKHHARRAPPGGSRGVRRV